MKNSVAYVVFKLGYGGLALYSSLSQTYLLRSKGHELSGLNLHLPGA